MNKELRIYIDYDFKNWNQYINIERSNKFAANSLKQKEAGIVKLFTHGKHFEGKYPVQIEFIKYFKDKRQDLDNFRIKGVLDGLVKCGVIKNDNLNCINKIILKAKFSKDKKGVEIFISENLDN